MDLSKYVSIYVCIYKKDIQKKKQYTKDIYNRTLLLGIRIFVFGSILLVKDWAEFNYNSIKRTNVN
jgi:hypothetical protein